MRDQIFYDPDRKRWKRLRWVLDIVAVAAALLLIVFVLRVLETQRLPNLLLDAPRHNYRALDLPAGIKSRSFRHSPRRQIIRRPSDVTLNSGEGLRAAYYVDWDPASYSSLKDHIHQIDLLFPEWLHIVTPDGRLTGYTSDNHPFHVVDASGVHSVDRNNRIVHVISAAHAGTEVFPMVSNFDPIIGGFQDNIEGFLKSGPARALFLWQVDAFLGANPSYHGLALDFEEIPSDVLPAYRSLIAALYLDFSSKNLHLYVNVPAKYDELDLKFMAGHSDGLLLMNYDQHETDSGPGPIAAQDWFVDNLKRVLKVVPKQRLICSIGNYGYDWTMPLRFRSKRHNVRNERRKVVESDDISTQEAWQAASDIGSKIALDSDSLNAHFAYDDLDSRVRHQVWFLDAVTVLNEMRAAHMLGINTFALWRLGSEDRSLWKVWDKPMSLNAPELLGVVPPGHDVDTEGDGDILRVTRGPQNGKRTVGLDNQNQFIVTETMNEYPRSYTVRQYGYHPKQVALTFDDGPDPTWTPKILNILKEKHVTATFLMIGEEAQNHIEMMRRVYREGHEIGSHTFTHPDLTEISQRELDLELNLTERLFGSMLGVQPLYFRPPYSIDQEPDTDDEARPVDHVEHMGYIILGDKIDTSDWNEHPRKTPREILNSVLGQLALMQKKPQFKGSVILMHDGGGDRLATVQALPVLIDALREHGYTIVPVSTLIGKTRAQVMPPLRRSQRWKARVDEVAFYAIAFFDHFLVDAFFVGDALMSVRLLLVGLFALIDRLRKRGNFASPGYQPQVAVLIPAYNEEKVIVRTIRSVFNSDYMGLRVIVIDDGSTDQTSSITRKAYSEEIANGLLTVLTKPNGGKAEALNCGLEHVREEVYIGIDADTVVVHDAISKLIPHFANAQIGAVAGNAMVGNRINLWTRWQALEYITSQNFERRALDLFDVVTVVPGAIGAWRTAAVKAVSGYHINIVAEDADLTMNLLEAGYDVIYEDQAMAFTEAPASVNNLMRQRFRWSFGMLQAVFKHRGALLRHRVMGLFALPNILIFQLLMPLVSPLIDLTFFASVIHYLLNLHFRPEAAGTSSFVRLLTFFLAFLVIDFITSALAFALERKHVGTKEDRWLLFHIFIQRFTYRQLFSLVLLKTVKRAFDGRPFSWDKLERTGSMSRETEERMILRS